MAAVWLGWTAAGRAWAAPAAGPLPPAAAGPVDFARDIKPLLEANCLTCHAHGQRKGGFQIDTREQILAGGNSGAGAVAGDSAGSLLIQLVAGLDEDRVMPAKGRRLTAEQTGLLRAWVDADLPWPEGIVLGRGVQAPLEPRRVPLPAARGSLAHPIDRLLEPYFAAQGFTPPETVSDRVFARRAYLDTIGLLPTPAELRAFEREEGEGKRERLVQRLLGDRARYTQHWLSFWNDCLRNDYRGTGYIDGGRKQITPWLYSALATNLPFDRFVARLVAPDEHSEGFTQGIVWRGVVNASQRPEVQAAQNLSQVFLGINLKCASCHDSFINDWKLADAYGLASIYAEEPLELIRCDTPTGQMAERKFLFPQLGAVVESTNRAERLESLAELLTRPANGRLTRTLVNRLWARCFGRGLVEPVDEMDNAPWHADLLDWLAWDFAERGYDVKRLIELMLTSRAYQLPAVGGTEQLDEQFVFRGPLVRRLSAEQFLDALSALTGRWHALPANTDIDFYAGVESVREPAPRTRWIWATADAAAAVPPQTIYLRRLFELPAKPEESLAVVAADNRFTLYVNGQQVGSGDDWHKPRVIDLAPHMVAGPNVLAAAATNGEVKEKDPTPNPAGFIFQARIRSIRSQATQRVPGDLEEPTAWDLGSDSTWLCATNQVEGWERLELAAPGWQPAVELGEAELAPWRFERSLAASWSSAAQHRKVRAALVPSDALATALGRPNREQVNTTRPTAATTLQALELTNGSTLAGLIEAGAAHLLAAPQAADRPLAAKLLTHALGREPTADELEVAVELLGDPVRREGVEDFLWVTAMLPEFQLIY